MIAASRKNKPFALALPLVALAVSVIQVRRDEQLGRSLAWAGIGLVAALVLGGGLICLLSAAPSFLYDVGPIVLILPLGLSLLALIANKVISVKEGLRASQQPDELQLRITKMGFDAEVRG